MLKKIIISSVLLNLGVMLGRLSGFAREAVLAGSLGVSAEADVAVLILSVPDLLVNILVGGALSAALIPSLSDKSRDTKIFFIQALLFFTLLFIAVTFVLLMCVGSLVELLAPGFSAYQSDLSIKGLSIVLWLIPLTVASGVVSAYLQADNRFFVPSLGTLVINITIIFGLFFIVTKDNSLSILAFFVILGGLLRLIMQYVAALNIDGRPRFCLTPWLIDRDLLKRYIQVAGAGSLILCFPVIARAFASINGSGDVAEFSYALKLVEFPLALTVTFLSVVFFPRLARSFSDNLSLFGNLSVWGLRITFFLASVSAVSMWVISNSIANLVYGYGEMEIQAVEQVSRVFDIGIWSIVGMGITVFTAAIFNAARDSKTPLIINVLTLFFLIASLYLGQNENNEQIMFSLMLTYCFSGLFSLVCVFVMFKSLIISVLEPRLLFWAVVNVLILYVSINNLVLHFQSDLGRLIVVIMCASFFCITTAFPIFYVEKKARYR
ncbi:lipid II flippase MurJ [uncultured Amphritea sp.]|uniref:murein biosynthesis integral membrane protein MurJ n=1 Tax=uncultured Amphritea sp. TaxID=981605 RepID=UPI002639F6C8|nr:lipid II flippase MurJ [uncultured Amphritea sp.]